MLSHLTKVNDTYVPPGSWWNIVPRGKAGQRRSNRVFLARREEELSKRAIVSFLFSLARVGEPHTYIYSYPRFEAEDGDGRVGRIRRIWPRPLIERGYRYQPLSAYPLGQRPSPQRRPGYLAQRIVSHLFPSPSPMPLAISLFLSRMCQGARMRSDTKDSKEASFPSALLSGGDNGEC